MLEGFYNGNVLRANGNQVVRLCSETVAIRRSQCVKAWAHKDGRVLNI